MAQNSVREAEPAQAVDGGGDGTRHDVRRSPRKHRLLRWSAATLAVLILGTAGAGYLYYRHLNATLRHADRNFGDKRVAAPTPNSAGQTPLNILLIGSDARNTT